MRILSAELHDYLSFRDCPPIEFREGINLVVGVNNSGKSALLKALNPILPAQANRSEARFQNIELPLPRVTLNIKTNGKRFEQIALELGSIVIPIEPGVNGDTYGADFLRKPSLAIPMLHHGNGAISRMYPGHGLFSAPIPDINGYSALSEGARFARNDNADLVFVEQQHTKDDSIPEFLLAIYRRDMFYFSAERLNVGESPYQDAKRLSHNADNLAAVLATLQGSKGSTFDRLKQHLKGIFPTFGNLSVRPKPGSSLAEIVIWPTEAMDEPELGFPLSESGTGVGQVLAILSVVMTTTESVIIIDEINSFLHPGAVKTLLRLLQTEYSHHQYIVSTHSPEVISVGNPSTLHLVQRRGYRSSVRALNLGEVRELREVTQELGISMADVFAADRILWVEGSTEEFCFPEIYRFATQKALPAGYKILAVPDTGRLTARKNTGLVFEIYRKLSDSTAPLVSDVKFSLDAEKLSEKDKNVISASGGRVEFLPRRHLECYLIHPQSILDFIADKDHFKPGDAAPLTPGEVATTLMRLAAEMKFKIPEWQGKLDDVAWLTRVDAANLIKAVCEEISEARVTFNKNLDSLALLRLVIRNNESQLKELCDYVCRLVDGTAG